MINYTSAGIGIEKVVFLHGWMMDHTCFSTMRPALDEKAFTYLFVDQRGYGLSRDQEGPFRVAQVAEDIRSLVDALKIDAFHIVGHSMAGKVISRLLADIPEKIKSAVGITPCPPIKIPLDDQTMTLFFNASTDPALRQQIFRFDTGNRLTDTWYDNIAEQSMQSNTAQAFMDYLDSWVNDELADDVKGCNVPVKILAGQNDPVLTADFMQDTFGKLLTNVEITEMANSGHYPMYEIPLSLAAECETFLKNNSH